MKLEELREAIATAEWSDPKFKKVAEGLADLWEAASKIKHASWCDSTKDIGCGCDCRVEELSKAFERLEAVE